MALKIFYSLVLPGDAEAPGSSESAADISPAALQRIPMEEAASGSLRILEGSVCAIGVFDGMHAGHRMLIEEALQDSRREGRRCVVLTFDRDPDDFFEKPDHMKLMDDTQRISSLADTGADAVISLVFDSTLAGMEPSAFMDEIFLPYTPSRIYVGEDFRFGFRAQGTAEDLRRWGGKHGMDVVAIPLLSDCGEAVTSSRIRRLLLGGDVTEANRLLGRPYAIHGDVVHGAGKGADMGFQTANLKISPERAVLSEGVYAAVARIGESVYPAAMSCGVSPTFEGERDANIEAHIIGFEGDLYGRGIELDVLERLRPMMKFDDIDVLIDTVKGDIDKSRILASDYLSKD